MNSPSSDAPLTFRELAYQPNDVAILERFYSEIYVDDFPIRDERESLENMANYLRLKAKGWYGQNNYRVLLGFAGEKASAASFADYLSDPNCAVLEFLLVARALRGHGYGRRLLEETERRLAIDSMRRGGVDVIVAEMNDPFRQREDSMDAFARAAIWDSWGYRRLDLPYIQPALSGDKASVEDLLLIAKPCKSEFASGLPTGKVKAILHDYMRWAMRIPRPGATREYEAMSRYLDTMATVPLLSLGAYVGRDAARPLDVREVEGPADPELDKGLAVYARAFPGGRTDVTPEDFRNAMAAGATAAAEMRYHFWTLRASADAAAEGMASFFTFPGAGFGGYVALEGTLRNTRRFPLLLARIEERMIRDAIGARGWYIECNPKQEPLFARQGFRTVDLDYAQPPLPGAAAYAPHDAPPLRLMYKAFGRSFAPPALPVPEFRQVMARVFNAVYGVEDAPGSVFFAKLLEQSDRWDDAMVRFR